MRVESPRFWGGVANHQPLQTGRVTAEIALRQDCWPRELRGMCEQLAHSPEESLTAMTLSVNLDGDQGQEMLLWQLSECLAHEYGLRRTITCADDCCNIRLARRDGAGS